VTAGAIDLIYATPDGLLCLVETKLWRNPEAHRTVLAQLLDYAKDLSRLEYSEFQAKIEAAMSQSGPRSSLYRVMTQGAETAEFDSILFEQGVRRSLATGNFLLLIVGDRIRPEVVLLSEILGTAPNLEFTLGLVEIAFYRLDSNRRWPVLAVPSVVARTHEVTRAVVRIRYEEKKPEVEVTAVEERNDGTPRVSLETFLKSLPQGIDEVFQPYLEKWMSGPFVLYWGSVGFSLRYPPKHKLVTIMDAYPTSVSVFLEKWLPDWNNPIEAYRTYRARVHTIPEVQRVYSQGKRYAFYGRMAPEDVRTILDATDQLAEALKAHSHSGTSKT